MLRPLAEQFQGAVAQGAPRQLPVSTGLSDGRMTEIVASELQPGMRVIVDQLASGTAR